MAPSHVPAEQMPLQGQNMYAAPSYQNLYAVDQYAAQSWDGQLAQHTQQPQHAQHAQPPQHAQHPTLVRDNSQTPQSWHHNTYPNQPYTQIAQPYVTQPQAHRTASPYQYGQFGNHAAQPNYPHAANVDPSLGGEQTVMRQQQQSPYQLAVQHPPPQQRPNTVTPQSLQQAPPVQDPRPATSFQIPKPPADPPAQRGAPPGFAQPVPIPNYDIPKGKKSGGFVVLDQAALAKATKSNALNKLVTFGSEPFHLPSNRTALPIYTPRQSIKDLKKWGADSKKLAKKTPSRHGKVTKHEASDSDSEYTSDDSDYSSDEEEESPLPATRPEEPQAAFRYDIIKATWYPRQSPPSADKIRKSLTDLLEVFQTIQKRWRLDTKAVIEAEEQKKMGDLPVLKRRVAEQRDLMLSALQSALEFSHPNILWQLGQVQAFVYLCYLFLANRLKMSDYDGPLSCAIMEILSKGSGTLTTEVLEKTKLNKALNMMKKNANDANKALVKQIEEDAAAGSKKAKSGSPPTADATAEAKPIKRPATQISGRAPTEVPAKKLKPTEAPVNGDKKPFVSAGATKTGPATQPKRPGDKPAQAPVKARGTQIVNRPSSLFASLNAAPKKVNGTAVSTTSKPVAKSSVVASKDKKPATTATKPSFSFADTMKELLKDKEEKAAAPKAEKQLPPETEEERTKRLRKESRRHLRVKFRPGDSLVSIKYFSHHPEEETGHDENFVRDAGDVGGEGRAFKQHVDKDEDEDEDVETDFRPWRDLSLVDFSVINPDERKRNYAPYGGGECQPTCPEREANIAHEKSTLMVIYQHPSDIPTSPREPLHQAETPANPVINFGPPPQLVLDRLPKSATTAPPPDDYKNLLDLVSTMSKMNPLQSNANQASYAPPPMAAPAPAAAPIQPDLSAILSALNPNAPQIPIQPAQPAAPPAMDVNTILAIAQQMQQMPAANVNLGQPAALPNWPGFPPAAPQPPQMDMNFAFQNQHNRAGHKRQRDDSLEIDRTAGGGKRNKNDKAEKPPPQYLNGKPHKVILCKFYQKGLCTKGDDCTFIHEQ